MSVQAILVAFGCEQSHWEHHPLIDPFLILLRDLIFSHVVDRCVCLDYWTVILVTKVLDVRTIPGHSKDSCEFAWMVNAKRAASAYVVSWQFIGFGEFSDHGYGRFLVPSGL